jgi:hypothetical protein
MSPTGQISPAIRFDRGVSFRACALQQGLFRANVLVCLRGSYPRARAPMLRKLPYTSSNVH